MQSRPVHGNIELEEYLTLLVDISLYGANEGTYYKVTGIHGALNRVLMNCKKLKEAGIRVALKTPVLNETLGQINEMKSIATKMGIPFVYTFEICPTIDKDIKIFQTFLYAMCRLALLYKEGRTRNITEDNARNLLLRAETMGESWATKILEKLFNNID